MTKLDIDAETYLIYPIFALGTAASLGIVSTDIVSFISLGDVVFETGDIEWTIGRALSVVALAAVLFNRDEPFDFVGWGAIEAWAVYVTIGLIIAPPFFPTIQETLLEPIWAFVAFTVQSIGFVLITYIN